MNMHVLSQNFNHMLRDEDAGMDDSTSVNFMDYIPGILFLFFVLVSITWGVNRVLDPHTLPIKHVSVRGDFHHLSPENLEERVSKVVRGGFFNVNVETINRILSEEPWVREVTVKRVWPDAITVYIKEQEAVALWRDEGLLNDNAELFSPDPSTFPANLPGLYGPEGSYSLLLGTYHYIQELLPAELEIGELILNDRRAWEVKFKNGIRVLLGRSDVEERIKRFARHVPGELGAQIGEIGSIDMRYTNGFSIHWLPGVTPELINQW